MDYSDGCNASLGSAKVAFLVLMGLPGSGKTTLSSSLPYVLGSNYHIIHICYDEVIPFKEVVSFDEKRGSWKSERAKVLLATEALLNDLLRFNAPENEKFSCNIASFPKRHKCIANMNHKSGEIYLTSNDECDILRASDKSEIFLNRKGTEMKSYNQDEDSSFSVEHIDVGSQGHYTILDSFNSVVSIRDELSDCDFQNEVFLLCIDDNCYYRSMRKEWWNLAAKYELPFCIITLMCDIEVCIKRVRERFDSCPDNAPNIPDTVIRRMDNCLEFPNGDLYHWEKHSVVINTGLFNIFGSNVPNSPCLLGRGIKSDIQSLPSLSKIRNLINNALKEPAKHLCIERPSSDSTVTRSVIHAADLSLRKIVSVSDPKIRLQINFKRKKILEDLKNRKVIIPSDVLDEQIEGYGIKFEEYLASLLDLHY